MSSPRKQTCRFFTRPGGCRRGNRCPDEHIRSNKGRDDGPSSGGRSSEHKPPRAPRGKCDFYWATGSCRRAFECKFEHVLSPVVSRARIDTIRGEPGQSENTAMPYLSLSGLADLSVSGGDAFRDSVAGFNPQETQRYLRNFLKEGFNFSSPAQMCSFGSLLSGASSLNNSWSVADGQLFLGAIATDSGCLRLSSILSYESVSSTSRFDPKILSFQRGYLPVFQYLSSKFVVKSTLSHHVNAVYAVLHDNLDQALLHLDACITVYMTAKSFKEKPSSPESSGATIFGPIVTALYEYLSRFKNATATYGGLGPFAAKLGRWIEEWADDITSASPMFDDVLASSAERHARELVSDHIKDRAHRVISIIEREQAGIDRSAGQKAAQDAASASQANAVHLLRSIENYYEGPGEERRDGPRHDNDFVDIRSIKLAPTDQELICPLVPFLPANLPDAPHPFPKDSMQRLLDIQFRLLREELLAPLRTSVQVLLDDLQAPTLRKTQLAELKRKKGGRYNYQDRQESVMFNVYTNVSFSKIEVDSRRGPVIEVQFDTPPGSARSDKAGIRAAYWANGKRLMHGGLVALLWKINDHIDVHLGILCSAADKLAEAARKSDNRLPVRVQFFDAAVNFKVLEHLRSKDKPKSERLLVESSVMFEAIRPFLESLQRVPETIPFSNYLPHPLSGSLKGTPVHPPAYSRVPNFSFNLECLQRPGEDGLRGLRLVTTDPISVEETRAALTERSTLDPSQAAAITDALTREIALIQGPPGTGKSFVGVELIRVLIKNNVGPILLIAFTNHALDHMLRSIIDKGTTNDVVRLGGRSKEESIKSYSIEEIEKVSGRSFLDRAMKSEFRAIKETEEEIMRLLAHVLGTNVPSNVLLRHISMFSPDHVAGLEEPPLWIHELHAPQDAHVEGMWQEADGKKMRVIPDSSLYAFWKSGQDLEFLRDIRRQKGVSPGLPLAANRFNILLPVANKSTEGSVDQIAETYGDVLSDKEEDDDSLSDDSEKPVVLTDAEVFLLAHGELGIPEEPTSDRPIETLLESENCDVWSFSQSERLRIDTYWLNQYREAAYDSQRERFDDLVEKHADLRQKQRNRDEEIRLNIIRNRRLIGCTTTGAAKLISLLKGFSPRVMIVEEAGQVLESHVLASLVDSVEHLVLIGDPLQLRPTLNNYALSMDSPRGRELYRFDMSLMERLSKSGFLMSRLDVQRRMRPEISCLIRDFLYPKLQDHTCVLEYESVRGMGKDVFFLSHGHKEHGGGDDSVSKHNPYEVSMIKDLVKYLLRQGRYSSEGSIVVLCAYLGQLARVRDALKTEVTVVIDERDQDALNQQEEEEIVDSLPVVERVQVTQRVKIRSVDNYQGEEADIVILSLVRNSGGGHATNEYDIISRHTASRIGFLKSENRTNVALSRAKHGLYILGNTFDLALQSRMWSSVISQLDKNGAVDDAIPIKCHRHPEEIRYVSKPGELPKVSPDGGCLRGCDRRLTCGHICPYKCHADDEGHRNVFCIQPCPKLCAKGHPCPKQCGDSCGSCKHPIRDVRLPCGHIHKSVPCHQMEDLSEIKCMVKVERNLPTCEHSVLLSCSYDVKKHKCQALCDGILPCCGKSCKAKCHSCQDPAAADGAELHVVPRTRHHAHTCGRPLYCAHECRGICSADHKCLNECKETCRQSCSHAQCRLPCSTPCAPCQEPCTWVCSHYTCPVPCGSVCARLPCNLPCEKRLRCGHRCPSVCGEDCATQLCLTCAPKEKLSEIADFIMQRPLSELDPSQGSIDELVITLPGCKHTFTVETLDGHCHMDEYYEGDGNGTWRSLKSPAPGFKPPPVCPTCRGAIRSPRYGRVYKRADLDILERNVTSKLITSLQTASDDFRSIDPVGLRGNIQAASSILHGVASDDVSKVEARENDRRKVLVSESELPVPWGEIDPGKKLHGIDTAIAHRWVKEVRQVKNIYKRTLEIASTRSAHVKAWEAAFSSLYRQEIERAVQGPSTAPRYPAEYAMRVAKMKVGLSKPLADKRFCVEALWLTISIRHLLANVAQEWLTRNARSPANFSSFRVTWSSFIAFILKTCERDAEVALRIAESTQSHKQALRSKVLIFNTRLETLKFDYLLYRDAVSGAKTRDDLKEAVKKQLDDVGSCNNAVNAQYYRPGSARMEVAEFRRFFLDPVDVIRKELGELEVTIRTGVVYSPLSYKEKQEIVAGLMQSYDLAYSGHFYQCPNGHPFVIGDCGGANQTARCPECFELIGGSDHSLISTNRRDNELEGIARTQGAQQSPWAWAA